MNTMEIEQLLERYFEGETTLREEKIIREFFAGDDIPEHLLPYRPIFVAFQHDGMEQLENQEFETVISEKINAGTGKVVRLPYQRRNLLYITSIAASIALMVGLFFTYRGELSRPDKKQLTENQQIAFDDATLALQFVSSNFNAGLKQVEHVAKIEKAMKNVLIFNKFYEYESLIINPDIVHNQSIKNK